MLRSESRPQADSRNSQCVHWIGTGPSSPYRRAAAPEVGRARCRSRRYGVELVVVPGRAYDVAYFLSHSLATETRRSCESQLIERSAGGPAEHGIGLARLMLS